MKTVRLIPSSHVVHVRDEAHALVLLRERRPDLDEAEARRVARRAAAGFVMFVDDRKFATVDDDTSWAEPLRPLQPGEPLQPDQPGQPGQRGAGDAPVEPAPAPALQWFELRVVDELGEPVDGVAVSLTVDGEVRPLSTDGDGRVRVDDATMSFASAKFADPDGLREVLGARWETIRDGEWIDEPEHHSYVEASDPLPLVSLASKTLHTVVLQPRVVCTRLAGAFFDTNKSFLLPSAVQHIRSVRALYEAHAGDDVLIVGHTDASGDPSYNDPLSLERAEAMLAYLRDDVDAWLAWYDASSSAKRWGSREDNLMLTAVLTESGEALTDTPLRHFQATRGLDVDGKAGPQTRTQLIREYMGFDGTTLPDGIEPIVHGCGESFPPEDEDAHERRVELFFFDGALGPLPPPPGSISGPGSPEYPEWCRRARRTHEFRADAGRLTALRVCDEQRNPIPHAPVRYKATGLSAVADEDGCVDLDEGIAGETCDLEWTRPGQEDTEPWPFTRRVFLHFAEGETGARRKLHNLGYPEQDALEASVLAFQARFDLEPSGVLEDIIDLIHQWHDGGDQPTGDASPKDGAGGEDEEPPKATVAPEPPRTTVLITVDGKGVSQNNPLPDAEVTVELVMAANGESHPPAKVLSATRGRLLFQFDDVEAGTHEVTARRLDANGTLTAIAVRSALFVEEEHATEAVTLHLERPAESVEFLEHGDAFGWDDHTENLSPWKSVGVGETDTVRVRIKPLGTADQVTFEVDNEHCIVSPVRGHGKNTILTVEGISKGDSLVRAMRGGEELAQFRVWSRPLRRRTVAVRVVHRPGRKTRDVPDRKLEKELHRIFKQAVFEFELTRLPAITVDYDLDGDKHVEVSETGFTEEQQAIIDAAKDDSFDYNIFFVRKANLGKVLGAMVHNQRYGFVFTDALKPHTTVAHELGHGAFGFEHAAGKTADEENLMHPFREKESVRLRKEQWDEIHERGV